MTIKHTKWLFCYWRSFFSCLRWYRKCNWPAMQKWKWSPACKIFSFWHFLVCVYIFQVWHVSQAPLCHTFVTGCHKFASNYITVCKWKFNYCILCLHVLGLLEESLVQQRMLLYIWLVDVCSVIAYLEVCIHLHHATSLLTMNCACIKLQVSFFVYLVYVKAV